MNLIPHEINGMNTFIMGWYAQDTSFCDDVIEYWNKNPYKSAGIISTSNDSVVIDNTVKESIDARITDNQLQNLQYASVLKQCADNYSNHYTESVCGGYELYPNISIQYYPVGGGYKEWHCERRNSNPPMVSRHLVFMTYLNDLEDGGTEFYYQNIRVKAEKGLTLIWPADWTFTHRGQVSTTSEKFIITGWFQLMELGKLENLIQSKQI